MENLPLPPFKYDELKSNITFGELQKMSFEDVSNWVDEMRVELLKKWDSGIPPSIGMDKDTIIKRFKKLSDYDISQFFTEDDLYQDYIGFIKNFSKMANSVNQFFPALLKSRIHGVSIYDYLSNENLWQDSKYTIVQKGRFDKMFSYSKYLINNTNDDDFDYFYRWVEDKSSDVGFWIENSNWNKLNEKLGRLKLGTNSVEKLHKKGVLGRSEVYNEIGFNTDDESSSYVVRYYDKHQQLFPKIFQVLRLGLNQVAVNFPSLTARWIYEKYLGKDPHQMSYKVYDPCAGWGGRLLGALCSNLTLHYIGTDVSTVNKGCYEELGEFYNNHATRSDKNTYEIYYLGSELIGEDENFKKHTNDVDLVFTSPPYFDRELYSTDKEQSCIKFPKYDDWLNEYLQPTLSTCYEVLKPERYCIINISDIKSSDKNFHPLEQDTISRAIKLGFSYEGKIGMCMTRSIGLNPTNTKNYWLDMKTQTTYKVEPILVFKKNIKWPWDE